MSKISPDHLARSAYVYVRQSTADQLRNNHESRRRQYALADRARALGWEEVVVIDDDLGVSACGVARPGFERLLAAICSGSVGAVVSIEASRLARNGRDWHMLLEFCALVGSVIVDEDGVYDPRNINDRLLLGMKGTMSEMELSLLRQRSVEALKLKAARGDLHTTVPIGYVRTEDNRVELDPDLRIREAISTVFKRFAQAGSVRQVLLWFRQEHIELPAVVYDEGRRSVIWRLPTYPSVLKILSNPIYGGAYVYGRTETRVRIEAGRKHLVRGHRRDREHWQVLIHEHHEGYIDWPTYEHNQRVIADNTNMRGGMARGAQVSTRDAELAALDAQTGANLTPQQRDTLLALGTDLARAWDHPSASSELRKRILRTVITEIVARVAGARIELIIHWQGGDHTELSVVKNRIGQHRWTTDVEVQILITQLARQLNDGSIAALLNRLGHRTGRDQTWTEMRVRSFRGDHGIAVYKPGEREERGEATLEQAADALGTSKMTVLRIISAGSLAASQACKGAPWVIKADDLQRPEVRAAIVSPGASPLPEDPSQISLELQ